MKHIILSSGILEMTTSQEINILKDIKTCYDNCDISEALIKVIEIACETSQISATSHISNSSYDSNNINNTFICLLCFLASIA